MIIPEDAVERKILYDDLVRQCLASREPRFTFYKMLRNYFLFGTQDESGSPYNKIRSTVETLSSFLYSAEGVKFSIHLGTAATPDDVHKAAPLSREISDQWRMSGTHLRFEVAAMWSLVFGSMLMKVQGRKNVARTYLLEPHQFGVLREDIVDLEDQEAFVMLYSTTKTQLQHDLQGFPKQKLDYIMSRVNAARGGNGSNFSDGMSRLLLANPIGGVPGSVAQQNGMAGGTMNGGLAGTGVQYNYCPTVDAELINMIDLYVWNDATADYQIVSIASPDVVIYDRPQSNVGVKGIPHFIVVRADNNLYDYFWGDSFVAGLAGLQDWRSEDVMNIRNLLKKQSDPPISSTGLTGIQEEKLLALRRAGGNLGTSNPQTKFSVHAPTMPSNIFTSLSEIDHMFDDQAGIGHILQGRGETGVRSRGQADLMARLGSSRPKKRALMVEECAANVATLMLRTVQENSDQRFLTENPDGAQGLPFVPSQFTDDYEVRVDAHSSSPIFIEDRKHDAAELLEAHAIDRETFLEMMDPPNVQQLVAKLKVIEKREQVAKEKEIQAELQAKQG